VHPTKSLATTHSSLALKTLATSEGLVSLPYSPGGAQSRPAIEQVGSVINRSANSSWPRAFFFFLCSWVVTGLFFVFWTRPHGVGMWHGVGIGLAWGWHGVGMGLAWGWHGVGMGRMGPNGDKPTGPQVRLVCAMCTCVRIPIPPPRPPRAPGFDV
jgi:hypothetical protein